MPKFLRMQGEFTLTRLAQKALYGPYFRKNVAPSKKRWLFSCALNLSTFLAPDVVFVSPFVVSLVVLLIRHAFLQRRMWSRTTGTFDP